MFPRLPPGPLEILAGSSGVVETFVPPRCENSEGFSSPFLQEFKEESQEESKRKRVMAFPRRRRAAWTGAFS